MYVSEILAARVIFLNEIFSLFEGRRRSPLSICKPQWNVGSLMRRQKGNQKLSLSYLLFYLRTGDFTFRIYVDYSGNVISLEMKGDQFYFRNILSALSLEGYIVIRREEGGREGRNHGTFVLLFLFQQRSFSFPRFDVFNTVFVRAIFLFLAPLKTFRRGSDRKESRAKEIIKVYTFHLWFLSKNPKTYFISKKKKKD